MEFCVRGPAAAAMADESNEVELPPPVETDSDVASAEPPASKYTTPMKVTVL